MKITLQLIPHENIRKLELEKHTKVNKSLETNLAHMAIHESLERNYECTGKLIRNKA